ncbi:hypothetical protein GCM10010987_75910 [Bradyrhizobium guangdongense]|uniref:Uncharacterized protein n=1 Tax=Bradyrhizobium guangdongense TaxID=1325090 RepID=A0AA88BCM0_9BRAD|nr:hypothetical protein GCM10010987_75910 [Bradyrhizobium guangdongense]
MQADIVTDTAFVNRVYGDLLSRPADPAGLSASLNAIATNNVQPWLGTCWARSNTELTSLTRLKDAAAARTDRQRAASPYRPLRQRHRGTGGGIIGQL